MAYGVPDWMMQGGGTAQPAQQRQPNTGNKLLSALAKGLAKGGNSSGGNAQSQLMARALRKFTAKAGGSGLSLPSTGGVGVGEGLGQTAALAGRGADIAATPAQFSLDSIAAGNTAPDMAAGGYLDSSGRALDTGFGDSGMGGGLRASESTGSGLQLSEGSGFGYDATANNGAGVMTTNGQPSDSSSGGSWGSAFTGALSGINAGDQNYVNDPVMTSGKDGFGEHHKDYRATIGGGTVGGLLGYYGGDLGSAVAGPVVEAIHPTMEKFTRGLVNTGDKIGDSAGAMVFDPIGTWASGKYSNREIMEDGLKYSLLGGLAKYL